ncbi:unnamed protein product [Arctia plantaginis]|uniref:Uncharacterized protein n=1 Tax=Arctia plantaginis TaxID=874455 RepID=A0A8S1A175_ARCPL|nr:unnamed protein product [Arctia plantaginis]CAB3238243.1 unnamed protein product [Arctia plantaginis]
MEHPGSFTSSPWAAMLGHGMHGMMQHEYSHTHAHASMPMDLHVPQPFPYYRIEYESNDSDHVSSVAANVRSHYNLRVRTPKLRPIWRQWRLSFGASGPF